MRIEKIQEKLLVDGQEVKRTVWKVDGEELSPQHVLQRMFQDQGALYEHLGLPRWSAEALGWHPEDKTFAPHSCDGFMRFLRFMFDRKDVGSPEVELLLEKILDGEVHIPVQRAKPVMRVWHWVEEELEE